MSTTPTAVHTVSYRGNAVIERDSAHIPCTDGFHRKRAVGLWTAPSTEQVVLVAPPAEAALLSVAEARELSRKLEELAADAEREHRELARAGKCGLIGPAYPGGGGSPRRVEVA